MTTPPSAGGRPAPATELRVGVVIPARDEAERIGRTIISVRRSLEHARVERSCIVVVADACSDSTASTARSLLRTPDRVIETDAGCVGAARAAGSLAALELLSVSPERVWLLGIDADSTAPLKWVEAHLALAARGIECVTGLVELDAEATPELRRAFDSTYVGGVDEHANTHDHVHGTNFGIRGDTLLDAGNWSRIPTGEDHALWLAVAGLQRAAAQDASIVVTTSARRSGRAPQGFASDLVQLA